jgi:hypothetical protein
MEDFVQDLKYTLRQLARRPGFAVVLVVTLALGIGANTAVFSVVDGVLLRPLPYPESDRLTVVWTQFPTMDLMEFPASWPEYDDYRTQSRSWEELGLWGRTQRTLTGGDNPERLDVVYCSSSPYRVARSAPRRTWTAATTWWSSATVSGSGASGRTRPSWAARWSWTEGRAGCSA